MRKTLNILSIATILNNFTEELFSSINIDYIETALVWDILPGDQEDRSAISRRWVFEILLQFSESFIIFSIFLFVDPWRSLCTQTDNLSIMYLKNTEFPQSLFIYSRMLQIPVTYSDIVSPFMCCLELIATYIGLVCHSTK